MCALGSQPYGFICSLVIAHFTDFHFGHCRPRARAGLRFSRADVIVYRAYEHSVSVQFDRLRRSDLYTVRHWPLASRTRAAYTIKLTM